MLGDIPFNETYDKIQRLSEEDNYVALDLQRRIAEANKENKSLDEEITRITRTYEYLQEEYRFLAPLIDQIISGPVTNHLLNDNKPKHEKAEEIRKHRGLKVHFFDPFDKSLERLIGENQKETIPSFDENQVYPIALESYRQIGMFKETAKNLMAYQKVLKELEGKKRQLLNQRKSNNKLIRKAEKQLEEISKLIATLQGYLKTDRGMDLTTNTIIAFLKKFVDVNDEEIFKEEEYKNAFDIIVWKKEKEEIKKDTPVVVEPVLEETQIEKEIPEEEKKEETVDIEEIIENAEEEYDVVEESKTVEPISDYVYKEPDFILVDKTPIQKELPKVEISVVGKKLIKLGKNERDVALCDRKLSEVSERRFALILEIFKSRDINPVDVPIVIYTYSDQQIENFVNICRIAKENGLAGILEKDTVYAFETLEQELYDRISVIYSYGIRLSTDADIIALCKLKSIDEILATSLEVGRGLFMQNIQSKSLSKAELIMPLEVEEAKAKTAGIIHEQYDDSGLIDRIDHLPNSIDMKPETFTKLTDLLEMVAGMADECGQGYYRFDEIYVPRSRVEANLKKLVALKDELSDEQLIFIAMVYDSSHTKEEIQKLEVTITKGKSKEL